MTLIRNESLIILSGEVIYMLGTLQLQIALMTLSVLVNTYIPKVYLQRQ